MSIALLMAVVGLLVGVIVGILVYPAIGGDDQAAAPAGSAVIPAPALSPEDLQGGELPPEHPDIGEMMGGEAPAEGAVPGAEATPTQ